MSAASQLDLIDATSLPQAFVETWRALEERAHLPAATLTPIFVRDVEADVWIGVKIDRVPRVVVRARDHIEAAQIIWKDLGRPL